MVFGDGHRRTRCKIERQINAPQLIRRGLSLALVIECRRLLGRNVVELGYQRQINRVIQRAIAAMHTGVEHKKIGQISNVKTPINSFLITQ